jgi:hypothetical protein
MNTNMYMVPGNYDPNLNYGQQHDSRLWGGFGFHPWGFGWGRPWGWGWGFGRPFFPPFGFGFGFPFFGFPFFI